MFIYALNSPVTRDREIFYTIAIFFAKIGLMDHGTDNNHIEELCRTFVHKGKQDPNWVINNMVTFLTEYKDRYDCDLLIVHYQPTGVIFSPLDN